MTAHLSTSDVARILGMREGRVRRWARSGFCTPARVGRRYAFSLRDVVALRTAKGLVERNVPAARVRRSLAALQTAGREPLSAVRLFAVGREVAVSDGETAWQPETGQTVLGFALDAPARPAAPEPDRRAHAQLEFRAGLDLEEDDPKAARAAYERALDLDPDLIDARVNLGRLTHQEGEPRQAIQLYERALAQGGDDPLLHFNLALALEDTGGAEGALPHYERALALDPDFADAHFNMAGLCEELGRKADAIRHYSAYRRLSEV